MRGVVEQPVPAVGPPPSAPKKIFRIVETVQSILAKLEFGPEAKKLTIDESKALANLKYPDGLLIIDIKDKELLMEIMNSIEKLGYQETYQLLSTIQKREDFFWNSPLMKKYKDAALLADDKYRKRVRVTKSAVNCINKECGGNNVTIYTSQRRSSDEPISVFASCEDCSTTWREG